MQPGDAATWATAFFTAVFAGIAYYQLRAQREELSTNLGNVGQKLDDLKAAQMQLQLEGEAAKAYQERTRYAQQVRLERRDGVRLVINPAAGPFSYSYLAITNESLEPIRTVEATFGNQLAFDIGLLDLTAPEPQQLENRERDTLAAIGPGETWYFITRTVYPNDVPNPVVCAWFTDVNGVQWRKNMIGELDKVTPPKPAPPGPSLAE
jgi:hypothetical protein